MTSSHASPTAPSQRSHRNRSHRDPAIRHSGRTHIRGKIRRIWRPRYLELVRNTDKFESTFTHKGSVQEVQYVS
jgi:hypothetical protein